MSAPFVIPFNNCPSSVSVKTASYTIPSGKYAKIKKVNSTLSTSGLNALNVALTKTFSELELSLSVDGLPYDYFNARCSGTVTRTTSGAASYTINLPLSYVSELSSVCAIGGTAPTSSSFRWAGTAVTSLAVAGFMSFIGPINQFVASVSVAASGSFTNIFDFEICYKNIVEDFWLPSGSVVSCPVGCAFIVTEYNQIS